MIDIILNARFIVAFCNPDPRKVVMLCKIEIKTESNHSQQKIGSAPKSMSQSDDITPCVLFCLTQRPNFLEIFQHTTCSGLFVFVYLRYPLCSCMLMWIILQGWFLALCVRTLWTIRNTSQILLMSQHTWPIKLLLILILLSIAAQTWQDVEIHSFLV